jgi:uncharacterized protein (TIGR02145 family)
MMKKIIKISVLVLFVVLVINSCEKENSDNPTNGKTTAVFKSSVTYGTLTDQDGNIYKTVTIGTQTWMAENLRTTKYRDGTAIPNVTDNTAWFALTTGAYCTYNNTTKLDSIATFGRLYNWYAVNTGKLCPTGWHVPSDAEWTTLTTYLGGETIAGGKLKETGTMHCSSANTGATNETGFTALSGGVRYYVAFINIVYTGYWWSATEDDARNAWCRNMYDNNSFVLRDSGIKEFGLSVRCVKD